LKNWTEQIFEIVPRSKIAKLCRRDNLSCGSFFSLQNWGEEILEIALSVSVAKQGTVYI
jgi:hypothetical protein